MFCARFWQVGARPKGKNGGGMIKRVTKKTSGAARVMLPRERSDYSAIVDRPPLRLPSGARIVFWSIVYLEVWDIAAPMARQVLAPPTGVTHLPDVPNWSWHEYGMRVGVWRFFDLFKREKIRPTLAINARVVEDYRRVAEEAKRDGWEFMGHSYQQGPIHKEPNQKAMIARSSRKCLRQAAGCLDWAGAHRDARDPGSAHCGGNKIYRRLGL